MSDLEKALESSDGVMVVGTRAGSNEDILVNLLKVLAHRAMDTIVIEAEEYERVANVDSALSISNHTGNITVSVTSLTDADRALKAHMEKLDETPTHKFSSRV